MKDFVLSQYMRRGLRDGYNLCINDGRRVVELLGEHEWKWASVGSGTTIVMRVIEYQSTQAGFRCPRPECCETWNDGYTESSPITWYVILLYDSIVTDQCCVAPGVMFGFKLQGTGMGEDTVYPVTLIHYLYMSRTFSSN